MISNIGLWSVHYSLCLPFRGDFTPWPVRHVPALGHFLFIIIGQICGHKWRCKHGFRIPHSDLTLCQIFSVPAQGLAYSKKKVLERPTLNIKANIKQRQNNHETRLLAVNCYLNAWTHVINNKWKGGKLSLWGQCHNKTGQKRSFKTPTIDV